MKLSSFINQFFDISAKDAGFDSATESDFSDDDCKIFFIILPLLVLIIILNTAFINDSNENHVQTSLSRDSSPFPNASEFFSGTIVHNLSTTNSTFAELTSLNAQRPHPSYEYHDDPDVAARKDLQVWIVFTKVRSK